MRRVLLACSFLIAATAALAAGSFYLDRTGTLWNATSTQNGLVLTATRAGVQVVNSNVPFPIGLAGSNDAQIQVAADDLTGKVVVVWQRNWSETASEIMLAVWSDGKWERIDHLSSNLGAHPRNPTIQLSEVSTSVPDPEHPEDPTLATTVADSFLHVLWWQGATAADENAEYALLCLTGDPGDPDNLVEKDLDSFAVTGTGCQTPPAADVLEHPLFAVQNDSSKALVFFGSETNCMFQLLEVSFTLDSNSSSDDGGMTAVVQRRRHTPIFGVRKDFPMIQDLSMEGARVVLGGNLAPVVYRVINGNTLEYLMASAAGWTPRRTLVTSDGLTMDQAIPLVENLAH
jgi:hypothetical protein